MHWSEEIAKKIIDRNPNKEEYVCAAGISPSGSIHIGNFRDIATSYFVVKALRKMGKKARLLFSWDEFDRLRKDKTTIFVSHRLSSATVANKIVVLEQGAVVEIGDHSELMKNKGLYYELFTTQAKRYLTTIDGISAEQFMTAEGALAPAQPYEHSERPPHGHHPYGHHRPESGFEGRPPMNGERRPLGEGTPTPPPQK